MSHHLVPLAKGGQRYLLRTNPDGTRQVSWRWWVLVWVLPVTFAAGLIYLGVMVLQVQATIQVTQGEVVKVYEWGNDAPQFFYPGDKIYSPVYRYTWTDGTQVEATAGTSHTDWNFPIGTVKDIRFYPDRKDDITLAGPSEWWVVKVIAVLTALALIPALVGTWWTRRWLARAPAAAEDKRTVQRS